MARKGKIEIGALVTVGAKEDGSLSKIEKRIDKLSNEEIEINIKGATKRLQELDKMEQKLGKNMASSIEATRKQLTDLITECKQEQKLRADNLKQIEQEVKAAKDLQKIEEKTAKTQKQKTNGPTPREKELADITKSIKGIRGVANTFDDSKIQKTEEKVRKLIGALDEYQTKLDAMKRLRKGNERTMYDTAKSEIADLKRALGAIQAVKDQTPSIKPKIEKKEKEVEQEKPKKTTTQQPVVGAGDSAKSIQEQTATIKRQTGAMESLGESAGKAAKQVDSMFDPAKQKKYTDYINAQIKDTERLIKNQQAWIKHLGWVFNDDTFVSSGKTDAYDKLKLAAMRYNDASRRKTAGISISEDEIELATIAWKKAYDEAVKQGVAERRLYNYKPPVWNYDSSLKRVQGDYDYRKKTLEAGEVRLTSLKQIQGNIEGFAQLCDVLGEYRQCVKDINSEDKTLSESAAQKLEGIKKNLRVGIDIKDLDKQNALLDIKKKLRADGYSIEQIATDYISRIGFLGERVNKKLEIPIQKLFETPSGQVSMFEGMSDPVFETVEAANELGDALQKVEQISGQISFDEYKEIEQQVPVTEALTKANNDLANSYLKVQEAAKKSLDVTDGSTFATILKYYKELLKAPQDNKIVAAQKALIEKAFNGAKTPGALNALQYADDSELTAMGNKLMLGASFEGEFLFKQIGAYLQDVVKSTIDWDKALESVEQRTENITNENSLLQDKISNLKAINSLLSQEELGEEEILSLISAYKSAMEISQDPEAIAFMGKIAEKFARAVEINTATASALLKDVTLSGEQILQCFEQLAEGVPLEEIKKFQSLSNDTSASYENVTSKVSDLKNEISEANKEAKNLADTTKEMIGYHGTTTGGFEKFDMSKAKSAAGIYLTDSLDLASKYANGSKKDVNLESGEKDQKAIYTYKVNGQNVLVVDAKGNGSGALAGIKRDGSDSATINGKSVVPSDSQLIYKLASKMWYEFKKNENGEYIRTDPNKKLVYGDPSFPGITLRIDGKTIATAYGTEAQAVEQLLQKGIQESVVNTLMYLAKTGITEGSLPFNKQLNQLAQTTNNTITTQAFANGYDTVYYKNISNEGVTSDMYAVKDPSQLEFLPNYIAKLEESKNVMEAANDELVQSHKDVASSAGQAAQQIEQQAAANKEVTETKIPVTPVVEPKATQKAIEESTGNSSVEVPITPVVEDTAVTQVSNDIINKLINGANIEQILTKYSIPSSKFDTGVDLFKDFAGALYQEDGKVGGEKVNEAFAQLADFIEKNAERTEQVTKTLEEFYQYMDKRQIRIPENMEETFAAEFTDEWKNIKKRFAIGGNYQNKKKLITTSKWASTPDVLIEELLEKGFGYALGINESFNGSAQDALRIILDTVQRAKDEAKLGKTQKIIGLDAEAQAAMYTDLSEAASMVGQNYEALNAAASAVNTSNDDTTESAEQTGEALKNQARSAEDAAKAMEGLQNQEQIDEKSVFPAEKVETEIDRIRKAIHSSEIGLDQIANTEGLQAAVAAYVKSYDEIDDKKFKLISADINEMAEGVDRVTLKFQSLEDENVKLVQTWAMNDGELTLGKLRTTKTFVDSESNFDTELERTVANSRIDALESQLIGIDHVSQKVTDSLTSLRTAAGNISSDSDIKTFAKNFQVAQNYVKEFKNEYKTLGSLANETQNAQAKMANAQETINAQISSSAKYIGVEGYDKVTQSIGNMTSALSKYNEAQKNISDGGLDAEAISKYEKQMADAFTKYNKAEKQLGAAMKEVRANANFDSFSKSMKDAEIVIDTAKLKLDKFGELEGVDKANGYIKDMTDAWKKFNDADSTIEEKAKAVKDFTSANESFTKQVQYLNEVQKKTSKEEPVSNIQAYYEQYVGAIKDLNNVNQQLFAYQGKNEFDAYSGLIEQLQQQKIRILSQLQDINSSVEKEILNIYNPISLDGDKYKFDLSRYLDVDTSNTIKDFFNNASVEAELGAESIQKFIDIAMQSQKIDTAFGENIAKQYKSIQELHDSISGLTVNGEKNTGAEQMFQSIQKGLASKLLAGTSWTGEQESALQKLIEKYTEYATALDNVAQKQKEYFKNKTEYVDPSGPLRLEEGSGSLKETGNDIDYAKEKLTQFVNETQKGQAIITGFTKNAIGISTLDYAVLDEATGVLRTFKAEMGSTSDTIYNTETSMKNMTAGTEAAEKALASMSQIMSRLNANGFTVDNNDYVKSLYEKMQSLRDTLAKTGTSKDAGDQSNLQNMANDANRAIKALALLENAWLKMNEAADGENVLTGGKIDKTKDVYAQMVAQAEKMGETTQATAMSIDGFDKVTNKLTFTLEGADGQVKTFVMSMDKLSGSVVASVIKIDKAKTGLQEFLGGIGNTGKQLLQYGLRMVEVYDIIRYLRQGFNEVLEIDTAMTELKKVTDETAVAYDNFAKSAYASSKKIGSTMKEFIQASADFARLGYSLEEASQLAEASNVYKNVGDGIDDVAQASESIISTMKAFNIEATDSMGIVDRFNEIGNNFAIDSVGIGEALQRSASALAEAGNSIDESIALVTAGNTVIQNPEQVGEMLADYKVA